MNLTREPTTVQAPPAETPNQAPEPPTRGAHDGLGEFAKRALRTCAPLRYLSSLKQLVLPLTMSNPHRPPRNRNNANNANNGTGPGSNRPPRDVCHDFWRTGTCSRTICRFRHERPATATAASATAGGGRGRGGQSPMNGAGTRTNVRSSFANQGINTAIGTASSGGMAQNLHPMDAGVAMTILENYCGPSGSVTELPRAGPLIRIINCIMSKGSNWRSEDRQDALQKLATNHGKLRLQELLEWENVSTKAETVSQTMSFQLGYIVILSLFCCEALVDCPLRGRCNELLSLVHQSYTTIGSRIVASMDSMVNDLSTRETDTRSTHPEGMPFHQMLQAVTSLHKEYIQRFKTAPEDYPQIKEMSDHLGRWLSVWSTNSISDPAELSAQDKGRLVSKLKRDIGHLSTILGRESTCVAPQPTLNNGTINYTSERSRDHSDEFEVNPTIKELVIRTFMPPGHLREGGPRHDNDHASVVDITISPTQQELTSLLPQYIPATFHDAPHHLPMHSMDRLLDIQFRLLREELVYPIKAATNLLFSDLKQPPTVDTVLKAILNEKGGRYKGALDRNAVFFSVYTNVELGTISADRRGIAVTLSFDTPPGKGRNQKLKERQAYWESAGKKRLNIGGLIALVWDKSEIHLGLITSDTKYLVASAKGNPNRLSIKVCFFEPIIERRAVEQFLANNPNGRSGRGTHLMFEIQTLYEAARPFLEALKVEPTTVAFSKYLIQHEKDSLINLVMDPPEYTTKRGFEWDLSCLFNSPAPVRMKVNDSQSIATAEYYMKNRSDTLLDPSQAEAMISCLTREVALIQGPPGTGKSYTAIQLLRVLVRNRVGPILMVAFTNHALDHLLESVLKNNITRKIVRLGGRSQSEALQPYLLDKVERFQASYLQRGVNSAYGEMKRAEEAFEENMKSFSNRDARSLDGLDLLLQMEYPQHYTGLIFPPYDIQIVLEKQFGDASSDFGQIYRFWLGRGRRAQSGQRGRPLGTLLGTFNVWSMLPSEINDLSQKWERERIETGRTMKLATYERARKAYQETLKTLEEFQSMQRLESLKNLDIIGCTTTGAARLLDLLKGLQPKIILVEEAGQVLEAHSLATLVPSVQHLIMIGDPQQLRPTINNYEFATENPYGGHLFKFDQSLMERLAWSGLPMAQLSIQRRMRPAVSNLIRGCLYPKLQDHASVRDYPRIRGMAKDVWFLHHTNKEDGGGEDAVSKCNMFEVAMVKSLVQFFLRQGVYNSLTSIVVLCAYLGQLTKVRDALSDCKLSVVLDERDEDLLVARGDDQEESHQVVKKQVDVSKQVRIRTVDNFQGEEADIVILSLVRNPGKGNGGGIGYLKSSNRANVALSRARHGMFVLGNGEVLENSNGIWPSVIQEFKQQDAYGEAFPFACHRHPNDTQWLSSPKEIDTLFPDGRCLLPCGVKLGCGHACPSKCHPDDDFHTTIRCAEPCDRLCPLGHPCDKLCFEECCCEFLVPNVPLPCGHLKRDVTCMAARHPSSLLCEEIIRKRLRGCEHSVSVPCHESVRFRTCEAICGREMDCCSRKCAARCFDCQKVDPGRKRHQVHPCDRVLHCQHVCKDACSVDHQCVCKAPCRQTCKHSRCTKGCAKPCTPCAQQCEWRCTHYQCPVSCGLPCTRLPCDKRCTVKLRCGHPCPSVCGEPCDEQLCPRCATTNQKSQVVDLVLQSTLEDVDLEGTGLDCVLITLTCKHVFTVETLDGVCGLGDYYERRPEGSEGGEWIRPLLPPPGTIKAPVCPQCRGEITSPRYGRVLKRSNLDLSERTVATDTAQRVQNLKANAGSFVSSAIEKRLCAGVMYRSEETPSSADDGRVRQIYRQKLGVSDTTTMSGSIQPRRKLPFSIKDVLGPVLKNEYGLPPSLRGAIDEVFWEVRRVYEWAYEIAEAKSAHTRAYESALSRVYRGELQRLIEGGMDQPGSRAGGDHGGMGTMTNGRDGDVSGSGGSLEEMALEAARIHIGMTPPLADRRFQVESIWTTIDLRLLIAEVIGSSSVYTKVVKDERDNQPIISLAKVWNFFSAASAPSSTSSSSSEEGVRARRVREYVEFVFDSCLADVELAIQLASASGAHRQVIKSELKRIRVWYEAFRFKVRVMEVELSLNVNGSYKGVGGSSNSNSNSNSNSGNGRQPQLYPFGGITRAFGANQARSETTGSGAGAGAGTGVAKERRKALAGLAKEGYLQAKVAGDRARGIYLTKKQKSGLLVKEEVEWVREQFTKTVEEVLEGWMEAERTLSSGTFYQPVSVEEKRQILQAFNFSHRGHWYICPNGHTFVIGECGGAMEVGRCNECGAEIGGGRHRLLDSNARAGDFEEIATRQGAERGPWE